MKILTLTEYTVERFVRELRILGLREESIQSSVEYSIRQNALRVSNYTSERGLICYCVNCDRMVYNTGPDSHRYLCRTCGIATGGGNMVGWSNGYSLTDHLRDFRVVFDLPETMEDGAGI